MKVIYKNELPITPRPFFFGYIWEFLDVKFIIYVKCIIYAKNVLICEELV